ncbi:ribose 5-phosphate isomerase A [Halobacteriales archaeon QH_10_67_13]|nr:MAG: ribose 5-phosphate isomerase A [Halobacteriales archaeon QH_10_67_13]
MDETERDRAKRLAGESAADAVADGAVVGLGTGSTAAYAIDRLGERATEGLDVQGVPTSYQARERARAAGIELTSLNERAPTVAIDGADQVAGGQLLKGGGAAHVREKIVDDAADRLVIVVDPSKETERLDQPVPVAVLSAARRPVAEAIETLGGEPTLRSAAHKDGPVVTDDGALVFDCLFGPIERPGDLAAELDSIPGVIGHGLFVDAADEVRIGRQKDITVREP